jgi:SanA protein
MMGFIKKTFKVLTLFIILLIGFFIIFFFIINNYIENSNKELIKDGDNLPSIDTVLVLGASVKPNKQMSDVFRDRVDVSMDLYRKSKVKKILVSGDSKDKNYDEVGAAERYLLEAGIPEEDIILDKAGYSTYSSLYNMKNVFDIKSMIIVTQDFHLPRALYICKSLEMECYGVSADLHRYVIEDRMFYREKLANIKAFLDVHFNKDPSRGLLVD